MRSIDQRLRNGILFLAIALIAPPGRTAWSDDGKGGGGNGDGGHGPLHLYTMGGPQLDAAGAAAIALRLGLKPPGPPTQPGTAPGTTLFFDAGGHVRGAFGDGSVRFFPDLAQMPPGPPIIPGRGQAFRAAQEFLKGTGISGGPATLGLGGIVTLTRQPAQMATPGAGAAVRAAKITPGKAEDVLRTVEFRQVLDGLEVYGPTSILSIDVGAGGVLGGAVNLRKIGTRGPEVSIISPGDATKQFLTEFPYPVTTGEGEDDGKDESGGTGSHAAAAATAPPLTGRLVSTNLIYYEQGLGTLQPAYLFHVLIVGPGGTKSGLDWLVPAVQNTPERIFNHPVLEAPPPAFAEPITLLPGLVCVQPPDIKYGRYVLREDDPGWLVDAQGFGANVNAGSNVARFINPSLPPVKNEQYFWNYPWLWEPTGSPATDYSPSFPGSVNVALIEGHGAPWFITTLKNCCDGIDLPKISGFGGHHSPAEITDYVIWQSCDVIPAPGDPYGWNFQSPASPFDLWFNLFQGLRGTYGYHVTMNIWNGVGKAMGADMGLGAQNLSAWFHECNNNVFGHNGGWNYGSAVLISGQEGDTLYDTCPLPPPGSLTIWWQHP